MLFGLPVIMYTDQASVGGMGLKRSGEKYADYLLVLLSHKIGGFGLGNGVLA
jgi:hypothetical protein